MTKLDRFHVNHNHLTGQMPLEVCGLSKLKALRADCVEVSCPCCTQCYEQDPQQQPPLQEKPPDEEADQLLHHSSQAVVFNHEVVNALITIMSPSSTVAIFDSSSPQHKAVQWLSNGEEDISSYSNERLGTRFALASLFYSTSTSVEKGEGLSASLSSWRGHSDWLSSKHECDWEFVECDSQTQGITKLIMFDNHMKGSLPLELGFLSMLEVLNVMSNELTGTIPSEIGLLSRLQDLEVKLNSLEGSLPTEIGQLTQLTRLSAGRNQLSGFLPTELGHLRQLDTLGLEWNSLKGSIPSELGFLVHMYSLALDHNLLSYMIPSSLAQMTTLDRFHVNDNDLEGHMPMEICGLESLKALRADCEKVTCSCCTTCMDGGDDSL